MIIIFKQVVELFYPKQKRININRKITRSFHIVENNPLEKNIVKIILCLENINIS